jgi:hypothetical protein
MTSVDTGWINDEKPIEKAMDHMKRHNFQTPLDEVDIKFNICQLYNNLKLRLMQLQEF